MIRPLRFVIGLLCLVVATRALAADPPAATQPKQVAALVADWFKGSHPDVLFTRIFETYTRDGKGLPSGLRLASVYRDLPTERDLSAQYAAQYGFKVAESVEAALTLGTGKLAVDGVLLSTEWAPYPLSNTGQILYPHRRLFDECVKVFKASGRMVPIFIDKHLADTWQDSQYIYETAKALGIPLMAGSSVQLCLLASESTIKPGRKVKQIVGVSYHTLTTYGFHGLEMTQALAEQREGGETGIRQVRCLTNDAVWQAEGKEYDPELLAAAIEKAGAKLPEGGKPADRVKEPVLFIIDYADGLRVNLFTLNGLVAGWAAAWRYADGVSAATLLASEQTHDRIRFDWLMKGVEDMIVTGRPSWPVERTLLTSGALDAALISKLGGGAPVATPFLMVPYQSDWRWRPPTELMTPTMPK